MKKFVNSTKSYNRTIKRTFSSQGYIIEEIYNENYTESETIEQAPTLLSTSNSKSFSLINILSTIEMLSSLFLLIKGSPFYQVLYDNISIDKVTYVVNTVFNPLNN